jgi:beta-lactamase superfamily II metal-dependent hydrolase
MKLTIFQSDMGDCLLLESSDGRRILCDGGMASSMEGFVRDKLGALRSAGKKLDFVYVSHVDNDHISGVVRLLQDELEWRIFEHNRRTGGKKKKPAFPRPPEIGGIWHNAFRDAVKDNRGDIESLLIAMAPMLSGSGVQKLTTEGLALGEIATAVKEGIKVTQLASADLLDIPINRFPGNSKSSRLMMVRKPGDSFKLGAMKLTIVGPTRDELEMLRTGWNNWLDANKVTVASMREQLKRNVEKFSSGALAGSPFDLRDWNGVPDFRGVTAPNIASLMFMVEEGGKRLLLTGDSQQDIILKGLEKAGFLANGFEHLDVLKVQHHGSENNMDAEFCRRISADHYVFCGNGSHGNPEIEVIELIYESRMGAAARRAKAPQANGRKFKFWFSNISANSPAKHRKAFKAVEDTVAKLRKKSGGLLSAQFNGGASIALNI